MSVRKEMRYEISGLEYVVLKNVPVVESKFGKGIEAALLKTIERGVATEIIRQLVPIRGAEVKFLRKVMGLSLERFGEPFGLSAPAILKWERAREKRLDPTNEYSVRMYVAELLGIRIELRYSEAFAMTKTPERLTYDVRARRHEASTITHAMS